MDLAALPVEMMVTAGTDLCADETGYEAAAVVASEDLVWVAAGGEEAE